MDSGPEPARFEVHALDPSEPCRVTIFHEARKLIAVVILKGEEPSPLTIQLQPWGTLTGRMHFARTDVCPMASGLR